jgi:uncharacterized protein YbbC (DUF1343 family)
LVGVEGSVYLGIDVLEADRFSVLKGKRVRLLTHPAGVNRKGVSTIDVLKDQRSFKLVALFGPEHGIYGNEKANQPIDNKIDKKTGLPVYSLYGKYRKPQPQMLEGIDTMVIDLQDIGVRSYTYISCMRYAMEACFENDIEVIILDRPNPLGGEKVDGPSLDPEWKSYVGAFEIPYIHGLTIGECAILSKQIPGWLSIDPKFQKRGILKIIPMKGWNRKMLWPSTQLKWVPTSPYIPSFASVLGYAMTGLGAQEGSFSHGIGSPYPFRLLSNKHLTAIQLERALESLPLGGHDFKVVKTTHKNGTPIEGVYVGVSNWEKLRPTALSFYMMALSIKLVPRNPFRQTERSELFNKHVGSTEWWDALTQSSTRTSERDVAYFLGKWDRENAQFKKMVRPYLIYR